MRLLPDQMLLFLRYNIVQERTVFGIVAPDLGQNRIYLLDGLVL